MIDAEAWQTFGGLIAILISLGGAAIALHRLGILPSRTAAPAPARSELDGLADQVAAMEGRIAVIEERTRKHERALEGLGKLHARIDGVMETTSRIEGEVQQMNRTLNIMLRHMLGEKVE